MLAPFKERTKGKKVMTSLDNILNSRDITLPIKVHLVKVMVFPVVMYRCESCAIKKADHWRIDGFELWCWRRLLIVPCAARRSNQSMLKEINPEYSLERLMLKLRFQDLGYLMWRADSLEKTLMLGRLRAKRRGWQRMRWLDSITGSMTWIWANSGRQWKTRGAWHAAVHEVAVRHNSLAKQ